MILHVLFILLISGWQTVGQRLNNTPVDDLTVLDSLLKKYDRRALPTSQMGIPTAVDVEIYLRSFGSINPSTMDYQVDLYLRQRWYDARLEKSTLSRPLDLNDPKLVQRIWKPEVFFANAKHAEFQYVTVPNVLVRIYPSGEILYMLRLKLTFSCMMDLYRFPLDSQVCSIELASFSKTTDELVLRWYKETPVKWYEKMKLPQFEINSVNTSNCMEKFHIGEYSCLKADFYLQRSIGYHLVQTYLPTILIVVMSWVSFWLDVEAIPARITLGVTTLLTISSKSSGVQSNLPPVSYVKAIDVWMGACTTFVFTALLEFALVNYLWRKKRPLVQNNDLPTQQLHLKILNGDDNFLCNQNSDQVHTSPKVSMLAEDIDHLCSIGFPVVFVVFNMFYWPYYLF